MKFLVNPNYSNPDWSCARYICGDYDCSILNCTIYSDIEPCKFSAPCPPVSEPYSNNSLI